MWALDNCDFDHGLGETLDAVPQGATVVLLSHNPDIIASPRLNRIDLVIAGHTHGGQLVLPLWGPAHTQSAYLTRSNVAGYFWHGRTQFYASYVSLAPKFGFASYGGRDWNDAKWYRTTPGEFGARASKLYAMLQAGHHDVKLPPEDLHRLTVWLDSCSPFYGVYEKEGGEAQLRGELAVPTLE